MVESIGNGYLHSCRWERELLDKWVLTSSLIIFPENGETSYHRVPCTFKKHWKVLVHDYTYISQVNVIPLSALHL